MLAAIVDRCLAPDPGKRFPNVQAVLDALDERASRLARRPMMVLGAVGPALLLAVVSWFAWQGFHAAVQESNAALTARALKTNEFAAQFAARNAAYELEHRYQAVERVAGLPAAAASSWPRRWPSPNFTQCSAQLSDPKRSEADLELLRKQFLDRPDRRALQEELAGVISATSLRVEEKVASWFFCDANGVSMVRVPEGRTIGKDFAWRSYFYGGPRDMAKTWRPAPGQHVRGTTLSAVFRSQATSQWTVAISTPVFDLSPEKKFLGVLAMTAEVGRFVQFPGDENQFAVLVDNREGKYKGVVVQHPLFDSAAGQTVAPAQSQAARRH